MFPFRFGLRRMFLLGFIESFKLGFNRVLSLGFISELNLGVIRELNDGFIAEQNLGLILELNIGLIREFVLGLILPLNEGFKEALNFGLRLIGTLMIFNKVFNPSCRKTLSIARIMPIRPTYTWFVLTKPFCIEREELLHYSYY